MMRRWGQRPSKTSGSAGATPPVSADPAPSPFGPMLYISEASVRPATPSELVWAAARRYGGTIVAVDKDNVVIRTLGTFAPIGDAPATGAAGDRHSAAGEFFAAASSARRELKPFDPVIDLTDDDHHQASEPEPEPSQPAEHVDATLERVDLIRAAQHTAEAIRVITGEPTRLAELAEALRIITDVQASIHRASDLIKHACIADEPRAERLPFVTAELSRAHGALANAIERLHNLGVLS